MNDVRFELGYDRKFSSKKIYQRLTFWMVDFIGISAILAITAV